MVANQTLRLGVIGAGKVGTSLGRLLAAQGYPIAAVFSRTPEHARQLADSAGTQVATSAADVLTLADLTLLTVPDDTIAPLAGALAADILSGASRAVVHTSGVHDASVLQPLAARGFMTGSLHPIHPFASVDAPAESLAGVTFAVEAAAAQLQAWLRQLIAALGGYALDIPAGGKATYHAAMVFASNYTVTLYALAERLLLDLGAERAAADRALNALLGATVENVRRQGIPDALTGPLVRADVGTIGAHLRALESADAEASALYRQLARMTYPLLTARGVDVDSIERLLEQEDDHATDRT